MPTVRGVRVSSETIQRLVSEVATHSSKQARHTAKRQLIDAIRFDGMSKPAARTLADRFVAEARNQARQAPATNQLVGKAPAQTH